METVEIEWRFSLNQVRVSMRRNGPKVSDARPTVATLRWHYWIVAPHPHLMVWECIAGLLTLSSTGRYSIGPEADRIGGRLVYTLPTGRTLRASRRKVWHRWEQPPQE